MFFFCFGLCSWLPQFTVQKSVFDGKHCAKLGLNGILQKDSFRVLRQRLGAGAGLGCWRSYLNSAPSKKKKKKTPVKNQNQSFFFNLLPRSFYETAHDDGIWSVTWTRRTNKIITGSVDDSLKIWNPDTLGPIQTLEGHQLGIVSVDSSPLNGQYAVSTSLDSQIRIWDIQSHSLVRTIDAGPVQAWTTCFSPDGRQIAAGTHSGLVNVWNLESGEKEKPLDTRGKFVMSVAYVSICFIGGGVFARFCAPLFGSFLDLHI
jgi:WD40 repeat protein